MRQKSDADALFKQFLADERMAGTPSAVEVVRSDEGGGFKGDFAKLCRRHNTRQEFTTADSAKFNGVPERHIAMIEPAGMAAQIQAKSFFRGFKLPPGSKLWSARNCWACYALNRTATIANVGDKSPFKICFGTVPQSPIPFLTPGYLNTKRQDKLRPKAFPCFSLGLWQTAPVIPVRCFSFQEVLFTLATSHGRGYLLQSLFLQKMCVLYMLQGGEGSWI